MELTITQIDFEALLFVGYRYDLGEMILEDLVEAKIGQDPDFDWDVASKGFTVDLSKEVRVREDIYHALVSDLEGGQHPMLSDYIVKKFSKVALEPKFYREDYCLPTWALGTLINDDWGSLETTEAESIQSFLDRNKINGYCVWELEEESYYSRSNDIEDMAGDVMDATLYRPID